MGYLDEGFGGEFYKQYSTTKELYDLIDLKLPLTPVEHKNWRQLQQVFYKKIKEGKTNPKLLKIFDLKKCKACGEIKSSASFPKGRAICITCRNKEERERLRLKDKEKSKKARKVLK